MRPIAWLSRSVIAVIAGALLLTAVTVGITPRAWRILNAHDQVPVALPEFAALSQRSIAYDKNNNVIGVYERENSQPVKLSQVPEPVISAFLAVEDAEFYHHNGFNLRGFVRAVLSNVSTDAPVQGASTITQQVVKNEFLAGLPRDGRYKALQAKYAMSLENKLTKSEILERYFSTVFFGNNAYGLQAAAEVYFGTDVSKLDLLQGAFLAGLVRSPSGYDPVRRLDRSRARFRQVIDRLVAEKLLTPEEGKDKAENWPLPDQTHSVASAQKIAPTYFSDAMRRFLIELSPILGNTEQERANMLYRGGLRIHTTLDPKVQAAAEQGRGQLPANTAGFDSAIVSLDVGSGAIRGMVGGPGFVPITQELNMALSPRQTGSSIKLFVLAAALQSGAQPNDLIDGSKPCSLPSEVGKPFVIEDGKGSGVAPLTEQTWFSINCAYSRLAQIVGLNRVVDMTYRMADSAYLNRTVSRSVHKPVEPFPSFATGANEMSPLDMAAGMQTLANNGLHHQPYYVERIENVDGSTFYSHQDPGTQVLDPGVALSAVEIMKGVIRRGTGARSLRNFDRVAAGKTGTQDANTNSWFVGATPQLATAVWVGNPRGYKSMVNIPEFVRAGVPKVQGGTFPAKIWSVVTDLALAGEPNAEWYPPPQPTRPAKRLYLPGNECLARLVSGPGVRAGASTTTTNPARNGWRAQGTTPESTDPITPQPVVRSVYQAVNGGTTIPPNVLDPNAPMPSVDLNMLVYTCGKLPAGAIIQKGG